MYHDISAVRAGISRLAEGDSELAVDDSGPQAATGRMVRLSKTRSSSQRSHIARPIPPLSALLVVLAYLLVAEAIVRNRLGTAFLKHVKQSARKHLQLYVIDPVEPSDISEARGIQGFGVTCSMRCVSHSSSGCNASPTTPQAQLVHSDGTDSPTFAAHDIPSRGQTYSPHRALSLIRPDAQPVSSDCRPVVIFPIGYVPGPRSQPPTSVMHARDDGPANRRGTDTLTPNSRGGTDARHSRVVLVVEDCRGALLDIRRHRV